MAGARSIPVVPGLESEYEMLRELGRGGMAVVYLARERATGREVAIKLVRAQYAEDDEALARFAREAAVVEQLHHPRIVSIHAIRRLDDGSVALIMEHVPGTTLKERIGRDGPFSPERAELVLRDIADALGYAHAQGIVHRDVKPENIFIEHETGHAFLSDFGIARPIQGGDSLTLTGVAIGTPTYMSPEQIDGPIIDGRSDLYSLGLVGWEMLAGRRPWDGESLYSIIYHQKHDPLPPLDTLRSDIPARLLVAIEGLLEKSPAARWSSAEEFVAQLSAEQPAPRRARAPVWQAPPATSETIQYRRPMAREEIEEVLLTPPPKPRRRGLYLALAIGIPASFAAGVVLLAARNLHDGGSRLTMVTDAPRAIAIHPTPPPATSGAAVNGAPGGSTSNGATGGEVAIPDGSPPTSSTQDSGRDASAGTNAASAAPDTRAAPPTSRTPTSTDRAQAVRVDSAVGASVHPSPPPRNAQSTDANANAANTSESPPSSPASSASAAPATNAVMRGRIVAGGVDTCLLTSSGLAYCWGGNDQGQLGSGNATRAPSPEQVAGGLRFASISPGLSHTCAISTDGVSYCWGANDHGQLGNGSRTASASPVRVAAHRRFTELETGVSHSCALTASGEVYCWGAGGAGQLGNGDVSDSSTPVAVASTAHFTQLAVGWNHSCALDGAGTAYCWGQNTSGQLGDGTAINRSTPTAVNGDLHFVAIAAGGGQSCGLTADGEAYCWGSNRFGQLGNGGTSDHATPVRVSSTTRFRAITAGGVHTCAITAAGEAECWGRNSDGQLGDGTTVDHATPVRVAGGRTFATISATGAHTCGTTTDGTSVCWGYNVEGQLGDGTRTHRTTPVTISMPNG